MMDFLLRILGIVFRVKCYLSARARAQIVGSFSISIGAIDTHGRTFLFNNGGTCSEHGLSSGSIAELIFPSSAKGLAVLISPNAETHLIRGLAAGDIQCKGDLRYILWLYEFATAEIFIRKSRVSCNFPNNYVTPRSDGPASSLIKRSGLLSKLPDDQRLAAQQRNKTILWQVGTGQENTSEFSDYAHVANTEHLHAEEEND